MPLTAISLPSNIASCTRVFTTAAMPKVNADTDTEARTCSRDTWDELLKGIKSISVKGGEDVSLYSGDCDFDAATGAFTLNASYLETLEANTYVTLFLTFDDELSTVLTITVAVTK